MTAPPRDERRESTVVGYAVPIKPPQRPLRPAADGAEQTTDPPTVLVRDDRGRIRELLPGSVVGDTYEVDARLGVGAMGEVYAARHLKLGKRVAIKVIGRDLSGDDAAIARFELEARTLARIQHPSIVAVEHVGELADGRAYFVMEYLRGESLFARLQRGRIPLLGALHVLDQVARGLEVAHAHGVVHRDLKPENTFLVYLPNEPPAVKLLDFGLSVLASETAAPDESDGHPEPAGFTVGTPMYMSPEQMRGIAVDHRTDIYALGCVAYELVLGIRPFPRARTVTELFAAHLHEAPPLPRSIWPEVPPQLDLALFAMLAKDPAHRPTLGQIRAVIADVAATLSGTAAASFVDATGSRRRWRAAAATVLLAGAAATGLLFTAFRAPPRATATEGREADLPAARDASVVVPDAPPATDAPAAVPSPEPRHLGAPERAAPRSSPPEPRHLGAPGRAAPRSSPPVPSSASAVQRPSAAAPPAKPRVPIDRDQTINPFQKSKESP